ncbi:ImmA/IrrE family metallo-endopeptidase [Polyangium spumosum]|uniref:ImmA/IrrE family metallo-endopeptidase n=1 Tax=Polyangium spumosum TaxID=889282 RepID=A0A6N7PX13_9BACT|nr:ImmA/IrrE family metallo-endopeptidase [Polyangium spumosum]MRG94624.1 ImmA/IrrE family metallo-endopeptidase [Polyangium spumosum]
MRIGFARSQGEQLAARLGGSAPPIDVKKVAEHLGLRVVEEHLGADVSGLLITGRAQPCICVQKDDFRPRKRFTIAHEIGHHYLRHQFEGGAHVHVDRGNFISQRSLRSSEGVDPKEIEANQFAAGLLMPSKLVREAVAKIGGPLHDHHVAQLARDFEVSEQAMTIRLTTLRLL